MNESTNHSDSPSNAADWALGHGALTATAALPPAGYDGWTPPCEVGEYSVAYQVGRGGMGIVYSAVHRKLKRRVAIKILPNRRGRDPRLVARFLREMEAAGLLDHPNIVRAHDAGQHEGVHYLVMEYIAGCDAGKLLRGPVSLPAASAIVVQACAGLSHAHDHGLVHRDVKPSNLLVTCEGVVKIADLGLSQWCGGGEFDQITASGEVFGTLDYMAPEQASDSHIADAKADVYSLGCTLFALLAGKPPFPDPPYDSAPKKVLAHATKAPPPLETLSRDLPADVAMLASQMLSKSPVRRPSLSEIADRLAPYASTSALASLARVHDRERLQAAENHQTAVPEATERKAPLAPAPRTRDTTTLGRRLNRRAWLAGVAAAAGLGGSIALALRERAPAGGRPVEAGAASIDGEPGAIWSERLGQPPKELIWPGFRPQGFWAIDEAGNLGIASYDARLIQLGSIVHLPYSLSLTVAQSPWKGGAGIFFGYRSHVYQDEACAAFQLLKIVRSNRALSLLYRSVLIIPTSGAVVGGAETSQLIGDALPGSLLRIGMTVGASGPTSISCNGADFGTFAERITANPDSNRFTWLGPWGAFNNGGGSQFSDPARPLEAI